jgi:hypothetical protein
VRTVRPPAWVGGPCSVAQLRSVARPVPALRRPYRAHPSADRTRRACRSRRGGDGEDRRRRMVGVPLGVDAADGRVDRCANHDPPGHTDSAIVGRRVGGCRYRGPRCSDGSCRGGGAWLSSVVRDGTAYRRLRGRAGLGLGDAKLLAALGAWVGLSDLPAVLVLACCLGLVAAGVLALSGRQVTGTTAIPFGPFLSAAGWVWWLYADCFSVRVWDDAFGLVFAGA